MLRLVHRATRQRHKGSHHIRVCYRQEIHIYALLDHWTAGFASTYPLPSTDGLLCLIGHFWMVIDYTALILVLSPPKDSRCEKMSCYGYQF